MRLRLMLIAAALLPWAASARTTDADCANARDPGRCEAQRAALKACADKRGAEKRACLDAALPPVDCTKAANPQRCEAAQKGARSVQGQERQGAQGLPARRGAKKAAPQAQTAGPAEVLSLRRHPIARRSRPATPHIDCIC
jgi:hypothetical protein